MRKLAFIALLLVTPITYAQQKCYPASNGACYSRDQLLISAGQRAVAALPKCVFARYSAYCTNLESYRTQVYEQAVQAESDRLFAIEEADLRAKAWAERSAQAARDAEIERQDAASGKKRFWPF